MGFGVVLAVFGLSFFIAAVVTMIARYLQFNLGSTARNSIAKYSYRLRKHIMTAYEEKVFSVLCNIFQDKCYVIPQVHLSKLLDHKVKGQSWRGAFSHINGKSVDFVLLRKGDLSPMCAIEIDDWSHKLDSRRERDEEVERMFASVGLPLVRLKNFDYMTRQQIVDRIADAMKNSGLCP